ncbi:tocopherol transfer protein-like [Seminavis robusta]|uniref:Tocopherol transfer protein-like n=1 Tax=Seminavis robusta TaxID=568900 RepID=A0A9N8HN39_9STRA|nr:tocopherol transfer protein-like [Seminavis robusta]|eukprot:Sro957_g224570.1 tocopherol transfer protein-like (407) ;mRNA; r:32096-33316
MVQCLIKKTLLKRKLKKQTKSFETMGSSSRSDTGRSPVPEDEEDSYKDRPKAPSIQRQVSVTKLVSGLAPQEDQPVMLHHHHHEEDVPDMIGGDDECKQEEESQVTRHDSFSSIDSLSEEERCTLLFTEPDDYGQRHPIETPQLIISKLRSFEYQLVLIPHHKKTCLKKAMKNCPELLTDKFKLMFLRCECFNEVKAAKRYAKYWEKRVEVFGPEKAFQPLTLDKALCDDGFALSHDFPMLSPVKHPSGRNILFADPSTQNIGAYTTQSMIRAVWYMFHAALEDEETQKKGLVFVGDCRYIRLSLFDKEFARVTALSVAGCLPVRLSGIHGYYPPKVFFIILPFLKFFLGERLRERIRLHGGENMEKVRAGMAKYGLVERVLPTNVGGEVELSHESWLQERRLAGL